MSHAAAPTCPLHYILLLFIIVTLTGFLPSSLRAKSVLAAAAATSPPECLECVAIDYGDLQQIDTCHLMMTTTDPLKRNMRPHQAEATSSNDFKQQQCDFCVRENLTFSFLSRPTHSNDNEALLLFSDSNTGGGNTRTKSSSSHTIIVTSFSCLPASSALLQLTDSSSSSSGVVDDNGSGATETKKKEVNAATAAVDSKSASKSRRRRRCIQPHVHEYVLAKLKSIRAQQQQERHEASSTTTTTGVGGGGALNRKLAQLNRLWTQMYENLGLILAEYSEQMLAQVAISVKADICWCNDADDDDNSINERWCNAESTPFSSSSFIAAATAEKQQENNNPDLATKLTLTSKRINHNVVTTQPAMHTNAAAASSDKTRFLKYTNILA